MCASLIKTIQKLNEGTQVNDHSLLKCRIFIYAFKVEITKKRREYQAKYKRANRGPNKSTQSDS
jgi:hypothetical protein